MESRWTRNKARSAALQWGRARERELTRQGPKPKQEEVVLTLEAFAPRFIEGYAEANRLKPSGIAGKKSVLKKHLEPLLGAKPLNEIDNEDVQRIKSHLSGRAPKTVNNVLTVLNAMLRVAVEWGVIDEMPCRIRLFKVPRSERPFHDFADYERLVAAARAIDPRAYLIVLLGGEAGLRCGEMMALEWTDVDLKRSPAHLVVRHSLWKGHVTSPKSGRSRRIPLTVRLAAALEAHKHLRGRSVLCLEDGSPLSQKVVQVLVKKAARKAGLAEGGIHTLRHTFCSHLAMRAASVRAIQELAGHQDLSTTQAYMHLSPAALEDAIRLLDGDGHALRRGEIVEAAGTPTSSC